MSKFSAKAFIIGATANAETTSVTMQADYANDANKEWSKYTPSLSVNVNLVNEIAEQFTAGKHVDITFDITD